MIQLKMKQIRVKKWCEMNNKKVKYIHILLQNETKFNLPLIKNINTNSEIFNKKDHLFVTAGKKVHEATTEFPNVVYDDSGEHLINKYAGQCDWIIVHGHLPVSMGIKIKKKYLKKIILRFWGGSIGLSYKNGNFLKNSVKKVLNGLYVQKVSRFTAFGVANLVDVITIRKALPDMRTFDMTYGTGKRQEILDLVKNEPISESINVLVGHNAWNHDNHIKVLNKLIKFGDKIKIYVPLSYGNEGYRAKVEKYIEENNPGNIIILKDFMPYDEYMKFLNKMNIAILDGEKSYALGNISVLLLLKKKLFVNRNGVIKEALDEDFIPHNCVDDIDNMKFEEFIKPVEYPEQMGQSMLPYSRERAVNAWKTFFREFN